ncbi:MAG TPA: ATP-binding protein [Longimicrobiaceae bacterium]|nr:ATP-binding protein [Longimicrobiaceae bacterium]
MTQSASAIRRRGLSLEYKVPLLITFLLAAMLALSVGLAYNEVRKSTLLAANERIQRIANQLAELAQASATAQQETMREVAADADVHALLANADSATITDAAETLAGLRSSMDTILPIEVWRTPTGDVAYALPPFDGQTGARSAEPAVLPDSGGYGPIHEIDGRTFYWSAAPIKEGDETVGYIAQLRRIGTTAGADEIEDLVGPRAAIYFLNATDGPWTSLEGEVIDAPATGVGAGPVDYTGGDGTRYTGYAAPIAGTPWLLLVELPLDAVLAPVSVFLQRLAMALFALILIGAAGAWLLSRGFIRPLKDLSFAAGAIAGGDYSRRVRVARGDEIGELGEAFNRMSAQVEEAHSDLQHQFMESQELADELEHANDQMQVVMADMEVAREDAEKASRAKSDFLATISHEIRTPINAIIGYTDLLLMELQGPLTADQKDHLERVRASGRHLVRLIDEVLDLARIESGQVQIDFQRGSSADAITNALSLLQPQAAEKSLTVEFEGADDGEIPYQGDPKRVEQIIVNMLANAVKFTDTGGRVTITRNLHRGTESSNASDPPTLFITVEDTGIGIPADKHEEIFEPFVQAETGYTRGHGGAGLGLAISRKFARIMGGDLTVQSAEGRGSTFTLRLPAAPS